MNKASQIKTHFDLKIIVFFIVLFIFSCLLLLYKKKMHSNCDVTKFKIEASSYKVGELITFSDTTKSSYEWAWYFGDSTKVSNLSRVSHAFEREGVYNVSLEVNGNCTVEKSITILPNKLKKNGILPVFSAPRTVYQDEPVQFKDLTDNATSWEWRFGDSGNYNVDATTKNPTYIYKTIGIKNVSLVVNGNSDNVKVVKINVIKKKSKEPEIPADLPKIVIAKPIIPGITEEKLEKMLYGIAKNELSYSNFSKNFCKSKMPTVELNDGRVISLKELDEEIRNKSIKIKKVTMEKKNECVTSITLSYKDRYF